MKTVLIEYTLKDAPKTEDVERHIGDFVAGIRDLGLGIRYSSQRKRDVQRAYAHIGFIPDDRALATMQSAPFFKTFADYLRTVCQEPPRVTWLETVATTDS